MTIFVWLWAQYPIVVVLFVVAVLVTVTGFYKSYGRDPRNVETRSCVRVVEADTQRLRMSKLLRREEARRGRL